jgi:hypothetical protein
MYNLPDEMSDVPLLNGIIPRKNTKEHDSTDNIPDKLQDLPPKIVQDLSGTTIDLPSSDTITPNDHDVGDENTNKQLTSDQDKDELSGKQDKTTTILPDTVSNEQMTVPNSNVTSQEVSQTMRTPSNIKNLIF